MILKRATILLILNCFTVGAQLQTDKDLYKKTNNNFYESTTKGMHWGVQLKLYTIFQGGSGLSIASGISHQSEFTQASLNTSINLMLGKNNLGNYKVWTEKPNRKNIGKRTLVTVVFSPMLSVGSKKRYTFYEELNPMYFGCASVLGNNFLHAFTLGTSFVTMPKGRYENMTSPRNRSQHLMYVQIKSGDFLINLIEDYLGFTDRGPFQFLADNRDRYYTGGGNVQFRVNGFSKIKFYTETYTGTSYIDYQDYPDIAAPRRRPFLRYRSKTLREKFAFQDPGQSSLNNSRNFFDFEIPFAYGNHIETNYSGYLNFHVYVGWAGGLVNGWQQHLIHNAMPIKRNVSIRDKRNRVDQLHHFDYKVPPHDAGRIIFGAGLISNSF